MKSIEQIRATYKEMDALLLQTEKDLKELQDFLSQLKKIEENTQKLSDFYQAEEWLTDRAMFFETIKNESYLSASEDGIWNLLQEKECVKITLLKELVKTM